MMAPEKTASVHRKTRAAIASSLAQLRNPNPATAISKLVAATNPLSGAALSKNNVSGPS